MYQDSQYNERAELSPKIGQVHISTRFGIIIVRNEASSTTDWCRENVSEMYQDIGTKQFEPGRRREGSSAQGRPWALGKTEAPLTKA
jgi:hypothetical protein